MRFNVVYHVATLNHWHQVVEEQLQVLLRNADIGSIFITIGAASTGLAESCGGLIAGSIRKSGRALPLQVLTCRLDEFEHPAMALIDNLVQQDDAAVLYFHAKGVSYLPPNPLFEKWRRYLNQFIAEADGWAELLSQRDCDACGPLKLFDRQHGYTYFAGNFWMAKAAYVRRLPRYVDFVRNPGSSFFRAFDRHLAEIAINRSGCLRALAADNTDLTHETIWPYLQQIPM